MGCGNKSSDKSQSNSRILLSGISYPAMSENNIVEFSKSDFTTGAIRSIEQIPLDMTIENRKLGIYIKGNYLLVVVSFRDVLQKMIRLYILWTTTKTISCIK